MSRTPLVPLLQDLDHGFSPAVQDILDGFRRRMGFVADSFRAYLHRPEIAEATVRMNIALNTDPSSTLERKLKRLLSPVEA